MDVLLRLGCTLPLVAALSGCAGSGTAALAPPTAAAAPHRAPTCLIIHAPHLAASASEWASYRRSTGWHVVVEPYEAPPGPVVAPHLRERIREVASRHGAEGLSVLLLGDADDEGVPTWYFLQKDPTMRERRGDPFYATDHPYQLLDDDDEMPDLALGRVPARSDAEALVLLAKVKDYERGDELGPWRRRVTYVAGEGRFGPVDQVLEGLFERMVSSLVPDGYDVTLSYAKPTSIYCPPPSRLRETVLDQLGSGAVLFNYVGHGSARRFDDLHWNGRRIPILEADDLQRLEGAGNGHPVALLACCSAGWYDLPGGEHSLAEAMLFHADGPAAVLAGSRVTHPYANAVLQKDVTGRLMSGRPDTLGALYLEATRDLLEQDGADQELDALALPVALVQRWPSNLAELRLMHARLYNLLGDPALKLDLPAHDLTLQVEGRTVVGTVERLRDGNALVTLETDRTDPARPGDLVAVADADDPDLDSKAGSNYPAANDRVLARAEAVVRRGRFEITLEGPPPPRAAVIKAYAWGTDDAGAPVDSLGALRLTPGAE